MVGRAPRLLFHNASADEIEGHAPAIVESATAELDAEAEAWVSAGEEQVIQQAIDEQLGK